MQIGNFFGAFFTKESSRRVQKMEDEGGRIRSRMALFSAGDCRYESPLDFVGTVYDLSLRSLVRKRVSDCYAVGCDGVIIVGIGGSSLGTRAVFEALENTVKIVSTRVAPKLLFLETVDADMWHDLEISIRKFFSEKMAIQVVLVSKSGTTLETAVNTTLVIELLRSLVPEKWRDFVTVVSDEGSPLWLHAQKEAIFCLPIPASVGGRYSVFSAVGLFPLALAGIDIDAFCVGGRSILDTYVKKSDDSYPSILASAHAAAWEEGYRVLDTFLFDSSCEALGKWYRQLCAESLGKREDAGFLPTVSVGTDDLHSMVQLYLAGQRTIMTTFVAVEPINDGVVPASEWGNKDCFGKRLSFVKSALFEGVQEAYRGAERPFITIMLQKTAEDLGRFMMARMIETVLLGAFFEVDPFDQPAVERYKRETRRILSR